MEWVLLIILIAAGGGAPAVKKKPPDPEPDPDDDIDIDIDPAPKPAPKPTPKPAKCTGVYVYPYPWSIDVNGVPTYGLSPAQLSAAKTVLTRVANGTYNTGMLGGAPCTASAAIKLSKKPYTGIAEYKELVGLVLLIYWKLAGRIVPDPAVDESLSVGARAAAEALMVRLTQYVEHATAP